MTAMLFTNSLQVGYNTRFFYAS